MQVIPPLIVTPAMLTSSSVPELSDGEAAYSASATYAKGARASSTALNFVWESAVDGNTGHPLPTQADTSNDYWIKVGPTNRWRMFDVLRNTATSGASPMTVTITPGERIGAIALLGLVADTALVEVRSGGILRYSRTLDLNRRFVSNWRDHFFAKFRTAPSFALFDLPPYSDAVITVTLSRATGNVSCGSLVVGNAVFIGNFKFGAQSGAWNFSKVDRDLYGNSILIRRRSVPKVSGTLITPASLVNEVRELRAELNAVPAVWCGIDDATHPYFESVLILGIYKLFDIGLDTPPVAFIPLELEEV